jgi:ADP-heptose:LPS heptosyltransferase
LAAPIDPVKTVVMGGFELPSAIAADARVLVYVGLDRVGDGLIKLPFVRALRAAVPDGELIWLAGKGDSVYRTSLSPLVEGLLDAVVDNADIGVSWTEMLGQRPLSSQEFDLVIDTQRRVPTTLILKRIATRRFVSGSADWLLSDVRPPRGHVSPVRLVEQLLELCALGTGVEGGPDAALTLPAEVTEAAAHLLPVQAGSIYVGLAPGAGGKHKCWPLDSFVTTARSLAQSGRTPVFILGPEEEEMAGPLAAVVPEALFPLQQRAAQTLGATPALTIALAGRLNAAVANDSGGGHMLAAAGVPLVSLFGPTDPGKFAPWTAQLIVLRAQEYGGDAMSLIPPIAVLQALEKHLGLRLVVAA